MTILNQPEPKIPQTDVSVLNLYSLYVCLLFGIIKTYPKGGYFTTTTLRI